MLAKYTTQAQMSSFFIDKMGIINVKSYGAEGDGVTDDTEAIDAMFATGKGNYYFPEGTYLYSGKLQNILDIGHRLIGEGAKRSIIKFTDSSVDSLFELTGINIHSITIKGICFQGPGKTEGSGIKGIYIHDNLYSPSNMHFEDVWVKDVSGTGFYIYPAFSWSMVNCTCQSVGGNGFEIAPGNSFWGMGLGRYNSDIDGWSYWFLDGYPLLSSLNTGDCTSGIRFGVDSTDPRGAMYCRPVLFGANIEPFSDTGILFEVGSHPLLLGGIIMYAASNTTVNYGIRLKYPGECGIIFYPRFEVQSGGAYLKKIYVDNAASAGGVILVTGKDQTTLDDVLADAETRSAVFPLGVSNYLATSTVGLGSKTDKAKLSGIINFSATVPATPQAGDVYWDDVNKVLKVYDGTTWLNISAT